MRGRENRPKVQIVREHNVAMDPGIIHDGFVGSLGITDAGPMNRLETCLVQRDYPIRREIHVDQDLHVDDDRRGRSISSTRHAA